MAIRNYQANYHFPCGLVSVLVICNCKKEYGVVHDAECPYWDQDHQTTLNSTIHVLLELVSCSFAYIFNTRKRPGYLPASLQIFYFELIFSSDHFPMTVFFFCCWHFVNSPWPLQPISTWSICFKDQKEVQRVYQYHFTTWPENSVPSDPGCVLNFVQDINDRQKDMEGGPIIVHCR